MSNKNVQHVVTGKVRLSYVHLFSPYAKHPGDEPKFSTTILIPKQDVATRQRIDAAMAAATQEGVSSKWNGVRPPQVAVPIYDGDGVRPSDGMPFGEECKRHWVMTASSKQKPDVVDLGLNPIINQSEIYSGVYARVSLRFFPYNSNGKKGIGCGLGNVQKLEDGEPLGGRTSAASDFGEATGYALPAYQQPAYPQAAPAPVYAQPQPVYQQQTAYGAPAPQQIDPITGKPVLGSVMGL